MNWKEVAAIALSCAITAGLLLAFSSPDQPLSCADGWQSSSLERQGACSHHGGVVGGNDPTPWYVVFFSFVAGFATLLSIAKIFGLFQAPETGPFIDATSKVIREAIGGGRKIEFQYLKRGATVPERRVIAPTELKMLAPGVLRTRCVVGYCYKAKDVRTFSLHRMKEVMAHEA